MEIMELYAQSHVVYVVKHIGVPGVFKVGKTSNLKSRISSMNCISPYGIEVVHAEYSRWTQILEGSILHKWADNRVNGEWIELNDSELKLLISDLKRLGEIVSEFGEDFTDARKAVEAAGYSTASHPKYKFQKNSPVKIIWKEIRFI